MKRKVLELTLEEVVLEVTGAGAGKTTTHLVTCSLVWPRPAIPEKIAVKPVRMERKAANLRTKPWTERILFKETVEGPFGVEVTVSEPVSESQLADFLRFAGSAVFKLAAGEMGELAAGGFASGLARVPFEYFSREIAAAGKAPAGIIGKGMIDLSAEGIAGHGKNGSVKLLLRADDPFYKVARARKHGEVSGRRTMLLKPGQPNGTIILGVRVY